MLQKQMNHYVTPLLNLRAYGDKEELLSCDTFPVTCLYLLIGMLDGGSGSPLTRC